MMYRGDDTRLPEVTGAPVSGSAVTQRIAAALLEQAAHLARACDVAAVLVYADALAGLDVPDMKPARLILLQRRNGGPRPAPEPATWAGGERAYLQVPGVPLSRSGQTRVAVFSALARGLLKPGDVILGLTGPVSAQVIDSIIVTQVGLELQSLRQAQEQTHLPGGILPEVLDRVLELATELGCEGREGRPIGTLFVVGDCDKVLSLSSQLILNPFRGYAESERNILDPRLEETVKELSSIDGAFVVRGDGVIMSAAVMLKTSTPPEHNVPAGLGARHHAAAGITAAADAIAVAISQSTGSVTLFRGGRVLWEIDKPRSNPRHADLA